MAVGSVLIVEDSRADRALYRQALVGSGWRVREAESVAEALGAIAAAAPDCVLLDYLLTDGTGLDLVRALVERDGRLLHPVVMLTGAGSESVAVEAMKAGVMDYAVKGAVSRDALVRAVENAIEKTRLQAELARRVDELEALAYVVSHDLRAPLRTVHQNAELLGRSAGNALADGPRRHLERVLASTRRMDQLIVALVEYCSVGRAPGDGRVELGALVDQVLSDLEAEVVDSGAEIEVGPLPAVRGDALRLRQLFQNLIGNALKFRRGDGPRVVVDARRDDGGWRVSVSDDGIGIDPRNFERIFAVFQRLPGAEQVPGTGIGLAICRKIAEQHGSRIDVSSQPGVGTTFSLVLPDAGDADKDEERER